MAAITANTGSNNWNTNGAWVGGVQPTAADDVTIPASAVVTIPSSTTALGRSLTVQASGTLAFAATTSTLNLGDGTAGAGNVALSISSSATITLTGIGTINFISTSSTQQTITSGGKTLPHWTVNGAGSSYLLSDGNTTESTAIVTLTTGTLNTNGQACSWGAFQGSGGSTKTITLGASAITITGSTQNPGWTTNAATTTVNAGTSVITFTGGGVGAGFSGHSSHTYYDLVLQGTNSASTAITPPGSLRNFTRTGDADKNATLTINNNMVATGTVTFTGNSATNRIILRSNTPGTARTITAAVVSLTNIDFQDITGAGAATWTGTSMGDCGGNTNITFDTPATQTHTASAGGNWSDVTKWTSRVPLPQDNVIVDGNTTGTLTADMPRLGADLTMTGFAGTFTNSISVTQYGSLTLASGQTFTTTPASYNLAGRSSHTITMSGKSFGNSLVISAPSGTYTMQDAFSSVGQVTLSNGSLVTGGLSFTASNFVSTGTATRAITLSTSTVTLTSTATLSTWSVASTGLTLSAASSTIVFSAASTNTRTFAGGGMTYGTLQYTVDNSPGSLTITGANTFATLNVDSGKILTMPSATTTTITNTFNVNGAVNGYMYMPGVTSNYASTPDSVALSITGDITLDVKVAMNDWTPAANQVLIAKYSSAANNHSYFMYVATTGQLTFASSPTGASANQIAFTSGALGLTDGSTKWLRFTMDVDDGAGNRVGKFYTSDDGSTWVQFGATQTTAGTTSIYDGTAALEVGSYLAGTAPMAGKLYNAKVYNSYLEASSGTPVFNADFTTKPFGLNTMSESSGNTAAFTGSYLRLPGVTGNYASSPDSSALSITGDITIDAHVALDAWVPATTHALVAKTGSTSTRSYSLFVVPTTGLLSIQTSPDGSAAVSQSSTAAPVISDGQPLWVRVCLDVNDGAGNRVHRFYTSSDGIAWTQLGTTITTAGTTSIFDSTSILEIGSNFLGGNTTAGKIYNARIYAADLGSGSGTPVFNADFTTSPSYARTLTESSANAATVTLNGGVTINGTLAQAGDGRVSIVSSTGASAATLSSASRVSLDYVTVQDNTAAGSVPFYAGIHGVLVSNTTNWVASAPPVGGTMMMMGI